MPEDFDPIAVAPEERKKYRYEGPEIIYLLGETWTAAPRL